MQVKDLLAMKSFGINVCGCDSQPTYNFADFGNLANFQGFYDACKSFKPQNN